MSPLRAETRRLLREAGIRPRRRLGQSFLADEAVLAAILRAAELKPEQRVLEIGAGLGTLTAALAGACRQVVAVEVDAALAALLRRRFAGDPRVLLVEGDALSLPLPPPEAAPAPGERFRVVANIPYAIATPLLRRLVSLGGVVDRCLLMVQREVAARLTAPPGGRNYGALTLYCRYRAEPVVVAAAPREAFEPVPAVDSVLVRLDLLPRPAVTVARPDLLFALVRAGFWQRRKMLRNALTASPVLRPLAGGLAAAFAAARVAGNRRAETLSLEEFAALAEALSAAAPALLPRIPDEEDDAEDPGGG